MCFRRKNIGLKRRYSIFNEHNQDFLCLNHNHIVQDDICNQEKSNPKLYVQFYRCVLIRQCPK